MASEHLLDSLTLVLRRGDRDRLERREDGATGKVYGGRFHEGLVEGDNWVVRLQRTLARRGFRFDEAWFDLDLDGQQLFNERTEWAVREFQIAASHPMADRLVGGPVALTGDAKYTGLPTGVLNLETLAALKAWDAAELICATEISGFGPNQDADNPAPDSDRRSDETNLWRDDALSKPTRLFARDRSDRFPSSRPAGQFHILGAIQRSEILGKVSHGPAIDERHAWTKPGERGEILPGELFDSLDSEVQRSTFRIIRAVTDVECRGVFEGINAYDDAVISVGFYHWTIKPADAGELPPFLAYLQQRDPVTFEKWFGAFGLRSERHWPKTAGSSSGRAMLQTSTGGANFTYAAQAALDGEDEPAVPVKGMDERRFLRNLHWVFRFAMAERDVSPGSATPDVYGFRRAQWDMARIRLQSLLTLKWPLGTAADPFPFVGTAATPATLGQTFRSERTLALILRWHVKRPGHVSDIDVPGGIGFGLKRAYAAVRGETPFSNDHDVSHWTSAHENHLAEAIRRGFLKEVKNDTTINEIDEWQLATIAAARRYRLAALMPGTTDLTIWNAPDPSGLPQQAAFIAVRDAALPVHRKPPLIPETLYTWIDMGLTHPLRIVMGTRLNTLERALFSRRNDAGKPGVWFVEVRDANDGVLRRFHMAGNATTPTEITIHETPVLSTARANEGTNTAFEMDESGLPRFTLADDPAGPMAHFTSTELNDLLDAGGDLDGTLWDDFHTVIVTKIPRAVLMLPKPAAVLPVEREADGPLVRWIIRTTNPNLEYLTLRRGNGSTDINVDWPGRSERYGGMNMSASGPTVSPNVVLLRKDLRSLGFLFAPVTNTAADETYDARVAASVRALQVYARRSKAAREIAASGNWVERLEGVPVPEPLRYHGSAYGGVNAETRALIDHWIAEKWRCPVVVDARTSAAGGADSIVAGKDNLWRPDDDTDPAHFFFVTDFSADAVSAQPLGVYRGGPVVQNVAASAFLPARREFSVQNLTGVAATPKATSTVKVLKAMADRLPCQGFLDGVDASDVNRVVNLATADLRDAEEAQHKLSGRLGALLSLAREVEPGAFGRTFGRDRIRSKSEWTKEAEVRQILRGDPNARPLALVVRPNSATDPGSFGQVVTQADGEEWRGWHSVYRLAQAARVFGIGRAFYDLARLETLALGALPVTDVYRLQDVFTTERAWAMVLYWHARYPGEVARVVANNHVPAQPILDVIQKVRELGHDRPFDTPEGQIAVVDQLAAIGSQLHTASSPNPDPAFVAALTDLHDDATLLIGPRTFQLDRDHLPHFKAGTAAGVITAVLSLGKPATNSAGVAKPGIGLAGEADLPSHTFRATSVLLSLMNSAGKLWSLAFPLAHAQEMVLDVEDTSSVTSVVRRPGDAEEELPVFRCTPDSDVAALTSDDRDWTFGLADALGETASAITGKLSLAGLEFEDGDLKGSLKALFDFELPFGDPLKVSLAGISDTVGGATFDEFTLDEADGRITAPAAGLLSAFASFLNLQATQFDFVGSMDGEHFATTFTTPTIESLDLDLVPTLVSLNLQKVRLAFGSRSGLGIDLADGIDRAVSSFKTDLFAPAGAEAVIAHACEAIEGVTDTIGKLFELEPADAPLGVPMSAGARLIGWGGRTPRLASALLAGLTKLNVNPARRLRSFAGELFGDVKERCHARFGDGGEGVVIGRDAVLGVWFADVSLAMMFNDEKNQTAPDDDVNTRDFLSLKGTFRFTCPGDEDFVDFGAGAFCLEPEVVLTVNDPNARKGRAFGDLVSLHVPNESVFVLNTDPTNAGLRWSKELSQANTPDKIMIRVPASDGADRPMSDPEAKRFTFEMDEFALGAAGFDLAGAVRVEAVGLNYDDNGDENDNDINQQTKTGLKAPLAVQKADVRPEGSSPDTPVVGEIRFQSSRLVFGSFKAGFQFRLFDDARGTISFAMADDRASGQLSITGTVDITTTIEYQLSALFATFQLKSFHLSTTVKKAGSKLEWASEGAISGAVKFQPPAGKSASGPLAAMSDFFSGITCEFEDLNPVKLGRGAVVTFNFPAKTFNLANVLEVDLNGITVGDSEKNGDSNKFGLLGEVRLKKLPGVGGSLTFGGIDLTETSGSGLPELDIKEIQANLILSGGGEIDATFMRIKDEEESGFGGSMTLRSDSLPHVSGLIKLTDVRCLEEDRTVPSLALYMGASIDAPLIFGFYLRGLGLGLGAFQGLRGLRKADTVEGESITQRVIRFVDDPKGLPDPAELKSWRPDPPKLARDSLNWMLVAQALITYGKLAPNQSHVIAGTLLAAIDQDLTLTLGTNVWLFSSPEDVVKPEFRSNPAARGAVQISPREGKIFAYFRTLPNPKLGPEAPELVSQVLNSVQASCAFLADGNGFLSEVGWPWEIKATLPLPSPLRGELTAGFRFGVYRGVTAYGLNFGIDVQMDAEAGFNFSTPIGSAGAHLSVHGSGLFRASFTGALDQAMRPNLLGDVRVAAQVSVSVEVHAELSKKITRWFKIRLRINISARLNLSVTAALAAAMDDTGAIGFSGDAHVAVNFSKYRVSGQVAFQYAPERVGKVRTRLEEILPPPIVGAIPPPPPPAPLSFSESAVAEATRPAEWHYRIRRVPGTDRILVALLPAPGTRYPRLFADPDATKPAEVPNRFSLTLKPEYRSKFVGFLQGDSRVLTSDELIWRERYEEELLDADDMQAEFEPLSDDGTPPVQTAPRALTVELFLHGLGEAGADQPEEPTFDSSREVVDPRTIRPSPNDADDETVGVASADHRSPNFGRDTDYDRRVGLACDRTCPIQTGGRAEPVVDDDDGSNSRVDGPAAALLAVEVLDLFGNDTVAARQDPHRLRRRVDDLPGGGPGPAGMFIAHRLQSVLVFTLDGDVAADKLLLDQADDGVDISEALFDKETFFVEGENIPLDNGVDERKEYDMVVGHFFQSRELIGLCWEFMLEPQSVGPDDDGDPFAPYKHGFEHFRVTRTTDFARTKPRVETVNACWLDPTQGARKHRANADEAALLRPPFQYVDRNFDDVTEGDQITYRVEAIGPRNTVLTSCAFSIIRRTVRPLPAPLAGLVLHEPKRVEQAAQDIDGGAVEIALLSPYDQEDPRRYEKTEIQPAEVRVRYRLVPASSLGSYGFDAPLTATTRPEDGLPAEAAGGLAAPPIKFSASPQGRPLPWAETLPWNGPNPQPGDITAASWEVADIPVPPRAGEPPPTLPQKVLRLRRPIPVAEVVRRITSEFGAEAFRGRAIEFWVGREVEQKHDEAFKRSVLVRCRHALLLPDAEPSPRPAPASPSYLTRGSMVAALEPLPPRPHNPDRFLSPNLACAEVVSDTVVPAGANPNDTLRDDDPRKFRNDVRVALTWRLPPEQTDTAIEPVVGFRVHRTDRFNPVLHRVRGQSLVPQLDRTVRVVPEHIYRSTPEIIELLAIAPRPGVEASTWVGDWRAQPRTTPDDPYDLWSPNDPPTVDETEYPFEDDPDRAGSTFLHRDLTAVARTIAKTIGKVVGKDVRPLWRVRGPFEDRADQRAGEDRIVVGDSHEDRARKNAARAGRFRAAFVAFAADHAANVDPYGWRTAEALGLSAELLFVHEDSEESVALDVLVRRENLLTELRSADWGVPGSRKPPVAILWFQADDGETLLNVVRLVYVGTLPDWVTHRGFVFRLVMGLKLLGVDPAHRPDNKWKEDYRFDPEGPDTSRWLRDDFTPRLRLGLDLAGNASPARRGGKVVLYRRQLAVPGTEPTAVIGSALPIQQDGTVRLDLLVPDRLAHVYDIALEPRRRYDELWDRLVPTTVITEERAIPFDRLLPVKVARTRPLVPHNVIAAPLPGAVQAYVFVHPAEFASCASAINAAAIEYSGQNVYLQRRIPILEQPLIENILNDREVLPIDWTMYGDWLRLREYEKVAATGADAAGRALVVTPPAADADPGSWDAMRTLPVTRVGIFGADRHVAPDLPAYYEYRFTAFSTAGTAQSAPAFTPFVRPMFDPVVQPPSTDGWMAATVTVDGDKTILNLEIVVGHSRLHLRPEMRGLWVDSDDTLSLPQADETTVEHRFGSLPDFGLEYRLMFNSNFPNSFKSLNPLVVLIPPLDPQRADEPAPGKYRFLAKSTDEESVKVRDAFAGGAPGREARVRYVQNADDGSIRVSFSLEIGDPANDTPKARMLRELLRQREVLKYRSQSTGEVVPPLFTFIVCRNGVPSTLIDAQEVGS